MPEELTKILANFQSGLTYRKLDDDALNISRDAAANTLGDDDFADWALVSDSPKVMVNYTKTFITSLASKLSANPFRPEDDTLASVGIALRLDAMFTDVYKDVLSDGYAYLGVGIVDSIPEVKPIDARYILTNGDDPTLRDATDAVVFEVVQKGKDEESFGVFPTGYVEFDPTTERVITSHYYKDTKKNIFCLDIYDTYDGKPKHYVLEHIDRIPIVRFVGDKIELGDKRFHYRGLYFMTASILKALTLCATKIQIRTAAEDDDNYIAQYDAIINHLSDWRNRGVKTYDKTDANGNDSDSITPIIHDNSFLINAFNVWKSAISDMLGPVVASNSEAVTREEVLARNEIRDAITNCYMSKLCDSIEEVYRCIQMFTTADAKKVVIVGGYIEAVKRNKAIEQLNTVYTYAQKSGLNTQGFVTEFLRLTDIPNDIKARIGKTLMQDPFASPQTLQLKQTIKQLQQQSAIKDQQIAILKTQATQRLERQSEYTAMQERVKRGELAFKQWQQEQKETQEGRMEVLKQALTKGDVKAALDILAQIEQRSQLVMSQPAVEQNVVQADPTYTASTQAQLNSTEQQAIARAKAAQGVSDVLGNSSNNSPAQ